MYRGIKRFEPHYSSRCPASTFNLASCRLQNQFSIKRSSRNFLLNDPVFGLAVGFYVSALFPILMKILCFIDSLGSGGAQRQLVTLAIGLKRRGHQVRFLIYHQNNHFLPLLEADDIACQVIPPCSYVQRIFTIRKILRGGWQDVVLAFLEAPSFYAELARTPKQRWGLVVGERSANPNMNKNPAFWLKKFHRMADAVVCNSHTNKLMLEHLFPFLRSKLCTVYNVVDLILFSTFSHTNNLKDYECNRIFRIVIAGRYDKNKNILNVAKAILINKNKKFNTRIVVDWFGDMSSDLNLLKEVKLFIINNKIEHCLRLYPATRYIAKEFSSADAIGLFSFYEGLPNVICEGMACGKPILLSSVCDADQLVENGKNGYLCDPNSPKDISEKMLNLVALSYLERTNMGLESRKIAERLFAEETVIERYEHILNGVINHQRIFIDCSWPTDVPQTALKTVQRWINCI